MATNLARQSDGALLIDGNLDLSPILIPGMSATQTHRGGAVLPTTGQVYYWDYQTGSAVPGYPPGAGTVSRASGAGVAREAGDSGRDESRLRLRAARMLSVLADWVGVGGERNWFTVMVQRQMTEVGGLASIDANDVAVFLDSTGDADAYVRARILEATTVHPYSVAVVLSHYHGEATFQVDVQLHPQRGGTSPRFLVFAERVLRPSYPAPLGEEEEGVPVRQAWALFCAWFVSDNCKLPAANLRWVTVQPESHGAWALFVLRTTGPLQARIGVRTFEAVVPSSFPDLLQCQGVAPLVKKARQFISLLDTVGHECSDWERTFLDLAFFIAGDRDHGVATHEGVNIFCRRLMVLPLVMHRVRRKMLTLDLTNVEVGTAEASMAKLKGLDGCKDTTRGVVILASVVSRVGSWRSSCKRSAVFRGCCAPFWTILIYTLQSKMSSDLLSFTVRSGMSCTTGTSTCTQRRRQGLLGGREWRLGPFR